MTVQFFRPGMNANGQPEPTPPAAPFPEEPGDMPAPQPEPAQQPPLPQQDDPGAEPPPTNLERVAESDPFKEMIEKIAAATRADRQSITILTQALINQLASAVGTIRLARDSIGRMGPDEIMPLAMLRELHEEAEALTIMLLPFSERHASVN